MSGLKLMCWTVTPFTVTGELDEEAFRWYLHRLSESKIGLYLASGGVGEAYTMSLTEIQRVYRIAVEECRGKVAIHANPPEQHTAKDALRHALLAIEAGCEAVNLYPPTSWHGYKATEEEQQAFLETLLSQINHPVVLCANPVVGYAPSLRVIADIARRYHQVIGIDVHDDEASLLNLKSLIRRDIDYYSMLVGFVSKLVVGATGLIAPEANIIPKSFRQFLDLCDKRDWDALAPINAGLLRFTQLLDKWRPSTARPTKMVMKVLKLPGGEGGAREPNKLPSEDQLRILIDGLLRVGLPEIEELLRAAGLS